MSHSSSQPPEITVENFSRSPRSAGGAWARGKRFADVLGRRMAYIERGEATQWWEMSLSTDVNSSTALPEMRF